MKRRSVLIILVSVVAVAGLLVALSIPADRETVACEGGRPDGPLVGRVGVSSHLFWDPTLDAGVEYAELEACGVEWVREDFLWDTIEPEPGRYDWVRADALMAAAARAGVQMLAIAGYSAAWASSDPEGTHPRFPPTDPDDYAAFAAALAARYGNDGDFWREQPDLPVVPLAAIELWNEPWGWWSWRSGVDPGAYARLALGAARAVRDVDADITILASGDLLQVRRDGEVREWLGEVLEAEPGLADVVDAWSVHPYPDPRDRGPTARQSDRRWDVDRLELIRDAARARGVDKPIWVTELGWSTARAPRGVTEHVQAEHVTDAVRVLTEAEAELVFLYTWTRDRDEPGEMEANYGFRRPDGSAKPSWSALVELLRDPAAGSGTSSSAPPRS